MGTPKFYRVIKLLWKIKNVEKEKSNICFRPRFSLMNSINYFIKFLNENPTENKNNYWQCPLKSDH